MNKKILIIGVVILVIVIVGIVLISDCAEKECKIDADCFSE